MKKKNALVLIVCLLLTAALFLLPSFADGEGGEKTSDEALTTGETENEILTTGETTGEVPTTGETTDGKTDTPDSSFKEPKGIGGIFNGYLQLIEGGGLVTRVFGKEVTAVTESGDAIVMRDFEPVSYILTYLLVAGVAYVLGSVNFGIVVSTKMMKDDVRNHGSGNSGMTNVLRTYGKKAAALTLLGDSGKAAISALLGLILAGSGCGYVALAFCMIGHAFPCFYKFKGGKCVASMFGGMLILEPIALLLLLTAFIIIVATTKYVSLGSVISATLLPIVVNGAWTVMPWHNHTNFDYFIVAICSVFFACAIVFLHRANLKRLYLGEERKTTLFAKKEKKNKKEENN